MTPYAEILKTFSLLIIDADGVLFSGHEKRFATGEGSVVIKTRSLIDGQGLTFLRAIGIRVLVASGESEPLGSVVAKLNQLPAAQKITAIEYLESLKGGEGKVPAITEWLAANDLGWDDAVYIGDDITDYRAIQLASLKVVPANATRCLKKLADIQLSRNGGDGAIREFAEMVLDARGINEVDLLVA